MSNEQISRILKAHSIPHFEKDGKIYADTMESGKAVFEEVENLTGYSLQKIRAWLGY